MTDLQKDAGRWQLGGWILLALGLLDLLAWHLNGRLTLLDTLHLGSRDRAWTLVILGVIAFSTAAILRRLVQLGGDPATQSKGDGAAGRGTKDRSV